MNDPYISCPYNSQHQVPKSRIQKHIVNCEKKYPPLAICPYNATHRYPQPLLMSHVENCPSRENCPLDWKPFKSCYSNGDNVKKSVNEYSDDYWD